METKNIFNESGYSAPQSFNNESFLLRYGGIKK